MKAKLYKEVIPELSATQQVLYNRGIPVEEQEAWLDAGWESINDWKTLFCPFDGLNKDHRTTNLLETAFDWIENSQSIIVLVDSDCDGLTSSAIFINYFHSLLDKRIDYILHLGKQHGLKDVLPEILETHPDLVVCPDAASNDREEHKVLNDAGIKVLVLDHHEVNDLDYVLNCPYDDTIIFNVQTCDYSNKALTGAGITWQFCRAYDNHIKGNYSDKYLDLAAIGNCGDMSDYREMETRALMNLGFNNIQNPFCKGMVEKNDYSIQKMNGINYYSMAFCLVPFINSLCRSGTMKEKTLVFESMLEQNKDKVINSSKRGHKGEQVYLWEEAVLVAERVKRRQTKLQDEAMELLESKIWDENLLDHSVILFLNQPGEVETTINGLVANKIQAKYQKPVLVLTKQKTKDDKEYFYRGSMRNYSLSPIQNFKDKLDETGDLEYTAGHQGACGVSLPATKVEDFLTHIDDIYSKVDQTPVYWVDYIWKPMEIDYNKVLEIGGLNIYGQNIPESNVAIVDIYLWPEMVTLMSPDKNPTLKIKLGDIDMIKFKSSQEEYEQFCQDNMVLNCICKCSINEWNGKVSPQLLVENFSIREEWIF